LISFVSPENVTRDRPCWKMKPLVARFVWVWNMVSQSKERI
jgi:hypothetical protein